MGMTAFRTYVKQQMAERGWTIAEVARHLHGNERVTQRQVNGAIDRLTEKSLKRWTKLFGAEAAKAYMAVEGPTSTAGAAGGATPASGTSSDLVGVLQALAGDSLALAVHRADPATREYVQRLLSKT